MTEMEKFVGKLFLVAIVAAAAAWGIYSYNNRELPCMAGQDEICPSPRWVSKYKDIQHQQDALRDAVKALKQGIPKGYDLNEENIKFTKTPEPPKAPVYMNPAGPAPAKK